MYVNMYVCQHTQNQMQGKSLLIKATSPTLGLNVNNGRPKSTIIKANAIITAHLCYKEKSWQK